VVDLTESDGPSGKALDKPFAVAPPEVSLPKGGGAIRGIGEKFSANPVTGTGSMAVPTATSPGRAGFGPKLSARAPGGLSQTTGLRSLRTTGSVKVTGSNGGIGRSAEITMGPVFPVGLSEFFAFPASGFPATTHMGAVASLWQYFQPPRPRNTGNIRNKSEASRVGLGSHVEQQWRRAKGPFFGPIFR
jgi:hypothetical protein